MSSATIELNDGKHHILVNCFASGEVRSLFHRTEFFRLHASDTADKFFQLVRKSDASVVGVVSFFADDSGCFVSPRRGTFGGFYTDKAIPITLASEFLDSVIRFLATMGARKLEITMAPASHAPAMHAIYLNLLIQRGAVVRTVDLNYDQPVTKLPFIDQIDYGNKKRVRKAAREGFVAYAEAFDMLKPVYEVIAENRRRHGLSVSMSVLQLEEMNQRLPGFFHLFSVRSSASPSVLVASAICLRLQPDILYVFYWGEIDGMNTYSPVVMLAAEIYSFCQKNQITLLDAGISTVAGIPNPGLIRFKESLGFRASEKLVVDLPISPEHANFGTEIVNG